MGNHTKILITVGQEAHHFEILSSDLEKMSRGSASKSPPSFMRIEKEFIGNSEEDNDAPMYLLRVHCGKPIEQRGRVGFPLHSFGLDFKAMTPRRLGSCHISEELHFHYEIRAVKLPVHDPQLEENSESGRAPSNPSVGMINGHNQQGNLAAQLPTIPVPVPASVPSVNGNGNGVGTSSPTDSLELEQVVTLKIPNLPSDRPLDTELAESAHELEFTKKVGEGRTEQIKFLLALVSHSSETPEEDGDKEEEIWLSLQLSLLSPPASNFGTFTVNVEAELLDARSRRIGSPIEWTSVRFSEGGEKTKYVKRNIIKLKMHAKQTRLRVHLTPDILP